MSSVEKALPKHVFDPSIVRAYDYRGIVGKTLFEADALALGRTFAAFLRAQNTEKAPKVCVGYDGRLTSPALERALVQGLVEAGADVIRVGLGPTPMLYFAVQHLGADAGIMITGSHNPAPYNGFKLHRAKTPVLAEDLRDLADKAAAGWGTFVAQEGAVTFAASLQEQYIEALASHVLTVLERDPDRAKTFAQMRVVWDCGNGAAGPCVRGLVERLPGHHTILYDDVDGRFPHHHPDPSKRDNVKDLIQAVREQKGDLGLAFDGDGDRLGVVDAQGTLHWPDRLMMLFAEDVLADHPGATIIADVKSSQVLFDHVAQHGGKPLCVRTGHSYIKEALARTGALLAGEMSGHIFFKDRYYGFDDALYAALRLLLILARPTTTTVGEAFIHRTQALPNTVSTPEIRVDCESSEHKFATIERLKEVLRHHGETFLDLDGVRFQNADGWWLLRASNTEDVLTSRCEARSLPGVIAVEDHMRVRLEEAGLTWPKASEFDGA